MSGNENALPDSRLPGSDGPDTRTYECLLADAQRLASVFDVPEHSIKTTCQLLDRLHNFDAKTARESLQTLPLAVAAGQAVERFLPRSIDYKSLWSAALLHDIGKIAVPKNIISRSNEGAEWTKQDISIMRVHPVAGAMVLRAYGLSEIIIRPVEEHHHKQLGSNTYGRNEALSFPERLIRDCVAAADFADAALNRTNTRNIHKTRQEREQEIAADITLLFDDYDNSEALASRVFGTILNAA